jgi:CRP-like cAMP-binding protein
MTAEMRENLRNKPLFAEFTDGEMDEFLDLLDRVEFPAGGVIVKQDESGDCMFVLVSGRAKVVHHSEAHNVDLAMLKPGDFFGELALVDAGPRSADVIAVEDCVLLKITHAALSALAGVYPTAAFKLLIAIGRLLVDRLRRTNQRYIDSFLFPTTGKD